MKYTKGQTIGGRYRVLFAHCESPVAESYRVSNDEGKTLFLQLLKDSKLTDNCLDIWHRGISCLPPFAEDFTDENGSCCVVTSFVSSRTLRDRLSGNHPIAESEAIRLFCSIADAVNSIPQGWVHTSLTADNILLPFVQGEKDVLLTGVADIVPAESHFVPVCNESTIDCPPEYFHGKEDDRSTVYRLGVILYEMLFAMSPWPVDMSIVSPSSRVLLLLKAKKKPLAIPELKVNPVLTDIIKKALSYEPSERYGSVSELVSQVRGIPPQTSIAESGNILTGNGFADVAGLKDLKEKLRNDVIDVLKERERARELGISIPNGILLYGPPGCGKTFFAQKLAEEIRCNYVYVRCSDIASPYIHGGQGKIAQIFDEARRNAPTLLFLDEVDSTLASRSSHNNVSESGEVNEFLTQLNNCGESGVFVVAATNMPDAIDKAALRPGRLEFQYRIELPDKEAIEELLAIQFKSRKVEGPLDIPRLAARLVGKTPAYVKLVVDTAARAAFKSHSAITQTLLLEALASVAAESGAGEGGRKKIGF